MKKSFTLLIALMMPLFIFGQSYSSLWKKVADAESMDLPKTEYEVLQTIVAKATKEKAYGQLLKAELKAAQAMSSIAPDSLKPAMERMQKRYENTKDEVLRTVYQTVLYRVYNANYSLGMSIDKPKLTPELCERLSRVKDGDYIPFVIKGIDSDIFDHDLLHVIGYELSDCDEMHEYYSKAGNRRAACITAAKAFQYAMPEVLDSLMETYGDLQEAGELAITRCQYRSFYSDDPKGARLDFIHQALSRWGSWPRMNILRNAEEELTNPQYHVTYETQLVLPYQSQTVKLSNLRNLNTLTMKAYRVNADGDYSRSPNTEEGYQKIKPLLNGVAAQVVRDYTDRKPYEIFEDTLTLEGLPVGVYMLEFQTNPSMETVRHLYYVSDVYTIAQGLPDEGVRYVVVSASTGQPLPGAHLRIQEKVSYKEWKETEAVTDEKGEYIFKTKDAERQRYVFAYTDTDKARPELAGSNRYTYYHGTEVASRTCIYTDRSIYRPGQTVHASVLLYQVKNGIEQSVNEKVPVSFTLRDANGKEVEKKSGVTDEYGVCAVDLTLPASGLTGQFTIIVNNVRHSIRVEEYKRPTFHVDFPEVRQAYAAGDTLTVQGTAKSFAGVPVQGAKVKYKVIRRTAFWWWSYSRYWDSASLNYGNQGVEVFSSETIADAEGSFDVQMPLSMPETSYPMFYHFVVIADVTDTAGETHTGEQSLPLGNRKQALSVDMAEKVLLEDKPMVTFHLLNAAGKDLDAQVRYRIDNGQWQTANTNRQLSIVNHKLSSGKHVLEATCEGDSITREFVLFSRNDQRPATETDDWFWQSATQFANDGSPVTVQVGSSDKDVHIVYNIFAGEKIIDQGTFDGSNALLNLRITYEEEYENGLLLSFAWVKDGYCHTHEAIIQRPMPDKKLRLQWSTFRDRLTPGQQEEWTLTVKDCDGNPVDAQLMATLYDKSLDMLQKHQWSLVPYVNLSLPSTSWRYYSSYRLSDGAYRSWHAAKVPEIQISKFDSDVFPSYHYRSFHRFSRGGVLMKSSSIDGAIMAEPEPPMVEEMALANAKMAVEDSAVEATDLEEQQTNEVQVRENLNETAFFYPQLTTDENGVIALKFTLPESLTTWRLMGLAHTRDLFYGSIEGEAVAQKDVMIQPNVPRFLRDGDMGSVTARIFNLSDRNLTGKAVLKLIDPVTNAVVHEQKQNVTLKAGETTSVTFTLNIQNSTLNTSLLICQTVVSGNGFSDGEQHYLSVLPSSERVTVTTPITQHEPGLQTVDLSALIPADASNSKLTFEYTNNPAWLMIQALPALGTPSEDNAISLAASYYANGLGKYIIDQNPQAKTAFELWKQEKNQATLLSQLEKNQELKDLVLNETPWVMDAENETEQRQRLADFFDENLMKNRLDYAVSRLNKLQRGDGSWSWWPDMPGSFYMTVAVSEMLVRLNAMTGSQEQISRMLSKAFDFMGNEIVDEVKEMKKQEKKGHGVSFPSFKALQWLYLATLDGRQLPSGVQAANDYLLKLLKKEIKSQTIYEKALTAVILSTPDPKRALEYAQSLKEYTVFSEETGRYYDTPRASYSWYDYKIPTQTAAIEALQRLTPDDIKTIEEMQRWLLQEKRTQAWDTPINSTNAVYAFLSGNYSQLSTLNSQLPTIQVDGKPLALPEATTAIGYVKAPVVADSKTLAIDKTSRGSSWGAVYAQFFQPSKSIADTGSGMTITRELLKENPAKKGQWSIVGSSTNVQLKVGDRIRIRISITADRDYDFVQVLDKRAACMEPVRQLSGWHDGSYCTPKDCSTNYYFDCLSKGRHIIENEYFIDRAGTYGTGSCIVECAYSPEFRAVTHSQTLIIKE